ncbi:MAG: Mur ligase family protein, partial [Bacteroidota bacterium]
AHLEGFGGIEGVKKGKSEMYRFIKQKNGQLFVNADDGVLMELSQAIAKSTYSLHQQSDIVGFDCANSDTVAFKFKSSDDQQDWSEHKKIQTHIIGHYNLVNCLAACCVGNYFNVPQADIIEALANYHPNMNRSQLVKTKTNTVILDAYNANPNSMRVAIDNFANVNAEKKILLLGDMFELGDYSDTEHQAIADLLVQKNFNQVVLVGPHFQKTGNNNFTKLESTIQCVELLKSLHLQQCHILIKGSRGMKMETLLEYM